MKLTILKGKPLMKNGKIMALSKSKEMCSFKTDYEKKSVEVQVMAFSNI